MTRILPTPKPPPGVKVAALNEPPPLPVRTPPPLPTNSNSRTIDSPVMIARESVRDRLVHWLADGFQRLLRTTTPAPAELPVCNSYWEETRRPLANLLFLLPLLLAYEVGVFWLGGDAHAGVRNGADYWMRAALDGAGFGSGGWLLPLLVLGALLTWHACARHPWSISWETLSGMLSESLLFAFTLILLGQGADRCLRGPLGGHAAADLAESAEAAVLALSLSDPGGVGARIVSFMGAGIYEEFLFRLCLIPVGYAGLRLLRLPKSWAVGLTVVASSLLFSLAHYLGPEQDATSLAWVTETVARVQTQRELWFSFVFRTLAGIYFAVLFCWRGFGIAAAAHAFYDVIVGVVLISEL